MINNYTYNCIYIYIYIYIVMCIYIYIYSYVYIYIYIYPEMDLHLRELPGASLFESFRTGSEQTGSSQSASIHSWENVGSMRRRKRQHAAACVKYVPLRYVYIYIYIYLYL